LDIGSNSAQLQVFEARPGAPPLPTHAVKEPTLLGEAFGPDGGLTRQFMPDDPPSRDQLAALRRHVNATLREVADRLLWEVSPNVPLAPPRPSSNLPACPARPPSARAPSSAGP
jgi:exopolyphosphatase/pppGpp-phosphohydrolase